MRRKVIAIIMMFCLIVPFIQVVSAWDYELNQTTYSDIVWAVYAPDGEIIYQQFVVTHDVYIEEVDMYFEECSGVTGTIALCTMATSNPSGWQATDTVSLTTDGWYTATFSTPFLASASYGYPYYLIFKPDNDCVDVMGDQGGNPYPGGYARIYRPGIGLTDLTSDDVAFRIRGDYPPPSVITLDECVMCNWVSGWQDHGPTVTEFGTSDNIYCYSEISDTDLYGYTITHDWLGVIDKTYTSSPCSSHYTSWAVWSWELPIPLGTPAGLGMVNIYYDDGSGDVYLGTSNTFDILNDVPILTDGDVDPNVGDASTTFDFQVKYTDYNGEDAVNHAMNYSKVGDSNWYQMSMSAGSGSAETGRWYDCSSTFPDDDYEFYFHFSDSYGWKRLPASGYYTFSVSTNHAPDNIPLYNITTFPTSFYRDELVLFNATTADQDGDQIKYGWDFNFDGTVDDWSDYYTSSVTSTVNFTYPIARNYSDSWNYTSGWDYNMTFSEDIWNHNTSIGANDTCENFLQQGDIYDDIDYIFRKNLTDDSWDSWIRDYTWNTVTNIDSYEDCPQYEYSFHMITILDNMTFVNNSGGDDFLINFSLDSSTSSNLTFDPSIFMFNDSLCSNNTPENFCKQIGVWDELSYIDCPADSQLWSKSGSGSLTEIVAWKTYKISLINYSGITINSLSVDYDAYPTSLPGWVQVKADDGNGGTTGWSDIVEITLDNYDPDSPALNGPSFLGLGEQGTWWLNVTDAEQDYMNVTILWGDGHDNHSGYVANGTNVSFTHIYDSSDEKIITIQIKDVFLGLTTYYDSVDIQGVPSAPTSIDGTPYNQMIHVSWSPPTSDGGQQITTYSINYWNHTLGAGSAIWIHNISFDNASGGSRGGEGYNITGLDNGQQYDFLMTANNTYGRSDYSDTYNATPGHTPPTTPTLDALGQYEGTAFDLTWSEPDFYDSAVLDKYYVIYSTDNENYDALGNTTARTYRVSGMINGETYYFRVYAIDNQSGQSLNSDYSWTQIDDINPTWPILEDLPIYSYNTSITVSWSASTDATAGINYYRLEEDDSTSFDQSSLTNLYESVDDTARSYTFSSNHQFGKTYYFRVRAYDKAGNPSEWNGPVQTKLKSNETEGDEYSKITEIWFNQNSITINKPVVVTVSVEDRHTIPTDYVTMTVNGVETVMRLSSLRKGYYSFDATWEPDSSGEVDVQLKVINANNAANTVTVPVDVESSVVSRSPSIVIFENADDIIVATFSEDRLNVSAYLDEYNMYHASFTEQPDEAVVIDLTNLDAIMTSGHWWIFDISWLDALKLQCEVHGYTGIKHYRVKFTGATIEGYNDFWSTYFGWVLGQDFTLVVTDASYITVSSLENNLVVKY